MATASTQSPHAGTSDAHRPGRRRRKVRWPFRLFLLLLGLALISCLVFLWAWRYRNDEYLARFIMNKNNPGLRGRFEIKRVHWTPRAVLDLAMGTATPVVIDHFAIYDPWGEVAIFAPRVEGKVELLPLVTRGHLTVRNMTIRGGAVRIKEHPAPGGGTELSIPATFQPTHPTDGKGPRISLLDFDVRDVDLKIMRRDWTLHLERLRSRGSFVKLEGLPSVVGLLYTLQPSAPSGKLGVLGFEMPLSNVRAQRFRVEEKRPMDLQVDLAAELGGGARARIVGEIADVYRDHPRVSIDGTVHGGQALLARVLGPGAAGPGRLQATIKGPLVGPMIEGHVAEVALGVQPVRATGLAGKVVLDPVKGRIGADDVSGTILGGRVSGKAGLNLVSGNWTTRAMLAGVAAGRVAPALAGTLDGEVRLRGTTRPMLTARAEVTLRLDRPRRDLAPKELSIGGTAHFAPSIIDLAGLTVTGEGNRITARGSVNLATARANLQLGLDASGLAGYLARRGLPPAVKTAQAELQVAGRWPALTATGRLVARQVGHGPVRLPQVTASVQLERGTLTLSRIAGDGYGGKLSGSGSVALFQGVLTRPLRTPIVQAKVAAEGLDLTALGARSLQAVGRLFAELEVSGPIDQIEGRALLRLPRVALLGDHYDGSWARIGILRNRASIYEGRILRSEGGRIDLWGDLFFDGRMDLRAKAQRFPVTAIPGVSTLPIPIAGQLSGALTITGTQVDPRLAGKLSLQGARVRGVALGSGQLQLTPGSDHVRMEGALLGDLLRIDGYLLPAPVPRMHLGVEVTRFALEKLLPEIRKLGDVRSNVSGRIQLDADARSGLTWASARLSQLELVLRYRPPGERRERAITLSNERQPLEARFDGKRVSLGSARLFMRVAGEQRPRADLALSGWLTPVAVDARMRGRVAAELLEFFLARKVKKLTGEAAADLRLSGSFDRLVLDGNLRLGRIGISVPKFDRPIELLGGELKLAPGKLRLQGVRLRVEQAQLAASGELELDQFQPKTAELTLAGDLNLRLLQLIFPAQISNASGTARTRVRVSGPVRDPQLDGMLALHRVEVSPRGWGRTLSLSRGQVAFTKYLIKTTTALEGTYDEGLIRATGEVRLDNWQPADIYVKIVGSGIPQRQPKVYTAEANLNLTLLGDSEQLALKGDVELVDARYIRSFDIIKDAFIRPRTFEEQPPFWKGTPLLESLKLELQVQSTGQLAVKNNYASLSLAGAISVTGTLSDPRLGGQIRVEEGSFRIPFLRGEYTISRGEISFDEKKSTDATEINITGETLFVDRSGSDYQIKLLLQGPLNQIGIQLSSVPALDQGQILALLAFGRTTDQLRSQLKGTQEAGGGAQAAGAADAQVKQLTGEILAQIVEDPLKKVTRLDLFRFEVGTESAQIRASKKLGRYVNLAGEYELGLLGDTRAEGRFEVKMHDLLMLVGKWERLSTRLETEDLDPSRGRVELKFGLPLR
jgi:hypothetical protein